MLKKSNSRLPKKSKLSSKKKIKIASVQALANRYARQRDCFGAGGAGCISCGKWFSYEEGDGGHYRPTTHSATRFNEINIHFQCRKCNRFLHANLSGYFRGLEVKIGREALDALDAIPKEHKWTQEELKQLKDYYNEKLKAIARGEDPRTQDNSGLGVQDLFKDLA